MLSLYMRLLPDKFTVLVVCFFIKEAVVSGNEGIKLTLTKEPHDVVVRGGGSATLDCVAVASDPKIKPIIKWRTSDQQQLNFIADPYRKQLSNGSLYLTSLFTDDGDQELQSRRIVEEYQCVASLDNIGAIASHIVSVSLAKLPLFEKQPTDIRVFLGQRAHFSCLVDVKPNDKYSVTWLKDQQPLVLDETRMLILPSGSLEIDDVQSSDKGIYRCNVTGLAGFALSEKATLDIDLDLDSSISTMAPVFIAMPRDTVAIEGNIVTFDCAANGNPQPVIVWLKDGVNLDMAHLDSRFRNVGTTAGLQISSVEEADAGNYQCRAENREDSVDAVATLYVQVPPSFERRPSDHVAYEKDDIELECEVYGSPPPKVHWLKNGELLRVNTDYMQLVNGNNLKILGLMAQDAGIFQCVASNAAGSIQASSHLTVLISGTDSDSNSESGQNLNTNTLASSLSPHNPFPAGTEAVGKPEGIRVPSAPQDLEAVITGARFITLRWKPPEYPHGEIISYAVFYSPDGSVRERVVNTSRSSLEEVNIQGLQPDRSYHLRVVAYNNQGPGGSSKPILIRTKSEDHNNVPGPPTKIRAIPVSPNSILVQWEPPTVNKGDSKIQRYKLYYIEADSNEQHHVVTSECSYTLTRLNKFTEYNIWAEAFNENGQGSQSDDISVRTLPDLPTKSPQNVTVEADSSNSLIVRWEPPPKDGQNGVITGYKLKYKKKERRSRPVTVTTAGDRRLYLLTGLERNSMYQIKLWAMNVNGTGPATEWINAETYENDLDEDNVPDPPQSMKVRPGTDSLTVSWLPPAGQNIMVRGYIIGWGKGVPDAYSQILDGKHRSFIIKSLEPNSEYVISVRANNNIGDGPPIYEHVRTTEDLPPEPPIPLLPPIGLKAIVLSSSSVVLYWSDSTLSQSVPTDKRSYVIRRTLVQHSVNNPRYKLYNSTNLNFMIDDLKPSTQYEFTVKVVKGQNESPWSMVVQNTTFEARPSTPPRDLTIVPVQDNPTMVILNWQPPKTPNGLITGYVVSYTTDLSNRDRDWVVEGVVGDKMTTTIKNLLPSTTYYFKILARNSKGYGPMSATTSFTTGPGSDSGYYKTSLGVKDGRSGLSSTTLVYIALASVFLLVSGIALGIVIVCCRRASDSHDRSKKGYMKGSSGKPGQSNIKPPDLWIHHDQMELKAMEKSSQGSLDAGPTSLTSRDLDPEPDTQQRHPPTNSLEKRTYSSYVGSASQPLLQPEEKTSTTRRVVKPKPIMLPVESQPLREPVATATSVGGPGASVSSTQVSVDSGSLRPMFPRTQYSISRAHVTLDQSADNPYIAQSGIGGYESVTQTHPPPCTNQATYSEGKRLQGHPLKSFSVPAPPPQSAPSTPQQKHVVRPQTGCSSSPYKKAGHYVGASTTMPSSTSSPANSKTVRANEPDAPKLQPSYSTEELNQEMANLEGLMKDLNAITASEFEC
ncbi:neogenin protein frazzled isoform X2 [Lycorma delicatula]|uniref:neogenin protein frazzled isoform X2 n=1 Tax=Lycorma delicatula TaxID=130591 RepID=UPI003F50FC56